MQAGQQRTPSRNVEQVIVPVPMPLEQACQVDWEVRYGPNKGLRGNMGKLLEDHKMDLGDLGYISTHGRTADERAAAITLLAYQLGQPQTLQTASRYGPEVIGHSRYLEDQQWESEMRAVAFFSIVVFAGVAIFLNFLLKATEMIFGENRPWLAVLIALAIVLAAFLIPLGLVAAYLIRRDVNKAKSYRLGREGEEWVTDKIRSLLDSRWVVFRNVLLPRRREDIDLILVGHSGVWALEVKTFNCDVRARDNVWERLNGKKWQPLGSNPGARARLNAMNLRYFLERHGAVLRVNAAVVLTQPQQVSNIGQTVEPVWKEFEVDERISQLNALPATLPEQDRARIVGALRDLVAEK